MDAEGDAVVVWGGDRGGLAASTRQGDGAWSKPQRIARPRHRQWEWVAAMAGNGDIAAARATGRGIQVVRRLAERPWRKPWTIPHSANGLLYDVAMDRRGDITVVWRNPARRTILTTQFGVGHGWRKSVVVGKPWKVVAAPDVAMDARGDATLAWIGRRHKTSPRRVREVQRPVHGRWTNPRTLTATNLEGAETVPPLYVAMDPGGDTTVAWSAWPDTVTQGFAQVVRRPAGGRWQAPVRVSPVGLDYAEVTGLAMDNRGDTSVSWLAVSAHNRLSIAVAQRPAHGSWHPATVVTPPSANPDPQTALAMGPHGAITVAWYDDPYAPRPSIQAAFRPAFGQWEPTHTLETGSGVTGPVGLAAGAAGRAVVTWSGADSHGWQVHAAWR
jgi:hypothetical protein